MGEGECKVTIGEYLDGQEAQNLRYAGSIDGGMIDTEYTPLFYAQALHQRERLVLETGTPGVTARTHICAADERITAVQEQVDALRKALAQQAADYATLYTDTTKRLSHLEGIVHQQLNAEPPLRTLPARMAGELAELRAEILPMLRAEVEQLRAFKASVPWWEIFYSLHDGEVINMAAPDKVRAWLQENGNPHKQAQP
jgi:hypothetical protein